MTEPAQCPACKAWFKNDPHFCAPFPVPTETRSLPLPVPEKGCRWVILQKQDGIWLEYVTTDAVAPVAAHYTDALEAASDIAKEGL